MTTFVDTSAFIALLDRDAAGHEWASRVWTRLITQEDQLITSNYVVVETCTLVQKRMGMRALRSFLEDLLPPVMIQWVDLPVHSAGTAGLMAFGRRGPSIVDCVSFALMRALAIETAFTLDSHFVKQGFEVLADRP